MNMNPTAKGSFGRFALAFTVLFASVPVWGQWSRPPSRRLGPQPSPSRHPYPTPMEKRQLQELEKCLKRSATLRRSGNWAKAIQTADKAIQIGRSLPRQPSELVRALNGTAAILEKKGNYAAARKHRQEALDLSIKVFANELWKIDDARRALEYVELLDNLDAAKKKLIKKANGLERSARSLYARARYAAALEAGQRAAKLRRRVLGTEHFVYAETLLWLAKVHLARGDRKKAKELYGQVVDIGKKIWGEKHPKYVKAWEEFSKDERRFGYAKPTPRASPFPKPSAREGRVTTAAPRPRASAKERSSQSYEQRAEYFTRLHELALAHARKGEYAQAHSVFKQAILDLGQASSRMPELLAILNDQANLFVEMGDYVQAETIYREIRDRRQQQLPAGEADYALSVHNLGVLFEKTKKYPEAEKLLLEALEIQKVVSDQHPDYAFSLGNLAFLYSKTRQYAKAEELYLQVLKIFKKDEDQATYARNLANLGSLYLEMARWDQAEKCLSDARDLRRKLFGEDHLEYAESLADLASLHDARNQPAQAQPLLRQALRILHHNLEGAAGGQSERQQLAMLAYLRTHLDAFVSLACRAHLEPAQVYEEVLAWKGAVLARRQSSSDRANPKLAKTRAELRNVSEALTKTAFQTPKSTGAFAEWNKEIQALIKRKEDLESEINALRRAAQGNLPEVRISAHQVRDRLPLDAALIDVLEYTHFSPPTEGMGPFRQERRLLAFVLRPKKAVELVSLGAAGPIAKAVQDWGGCITRGEVQSLESARASLADQVWKPLANHLTNVQSVWVAPDGVLTQVPLAALPGRKSTYLLEEISIGYVSSGRQVIDLIGARDEEPGKGLLAIGGIQYQSVPGAAVASLDTVPFAQRSGFGYLAGTEPEAALCRDLFQKTYPGEKIQFLTGVEPYKTRVKDECAKKYRYLHLATHGFFESPNRLKAMRGGVREEPGLYQPAEDAVLSWTPMLRSGVVLAGAASRDQDGILTAEEVATLDLTGTDLVVLSACETGLGKVESGEGILGLQRAFQAAGARALITSLWKVDDAATVVLMEEFYANLWVKKLPKLDALRQAQLTVLRDPERVDQKRQFLGAESKKRGLGMLSKPLPGGGKIDNRSHPALWAAFILSGDGR